jgi:hypothetical protein
MKNMTRDELADFLGEGFHTAFRKAADYPEAMHIHRLISKMPPDQWTAVIDFVTDALMPLIGTKQDHT